MKSILPIMFVFFMFLSSCALLPENRSRQDTKASKKWVPQNQYDDLLLKYEALQKDYDRLKVDRSMQVTETLDVVDESKIISMNPSSAKKNEALSNHKKSTPVKKVVTKKVSTVMVNQDKIKKQNMLYAKALNLKQQGQFSKAHEIFEQLSQSADEQIQVRSEIKMADIFMIKGQFDLAYQVLEGLIKSRSYSGLVLEALKKIVVCADNLNLSEERAKYQSILKDFFKI